MIVRYPSLTAYRLALAEPSHPDTDANHSVTHGRSDPNWSLRADWGKAEEMARIGWAEGARVIRALSEKIRDALEPPEMLAATYDVAPFGADVQLDMGRFVDGDPEHWRVQAPRRGGRITVAVSVNALACVDAASMARRGAVGLAIAWVLFDAGYEVELLGMKVNRDTVRGGAIGPTWAMPLEPVLCAYWLGHPASMRRHGFRWLENFAPWLANHGHGATDVACEKQALPPGALHIPGLRSDAGWQSDDEAIDQARKYLASLGSLDPTH